MHIEFSLKKIRTQIKFGRSVDAGEALRLLWNEYKETDHEKTILEVLALDLLRKRKSYKEAIPVLHRLLSLNIDDDIKGDAIAFLKEAEDSENLIFSEPNACNPEFLEFMETVRRKDIFKASPETLNFLEYFIVNDISSAEKLAWRQEIAKPFRSWNMLRTHASREIHKYYTEKKINMNNMYDEVSNEIAVIFETSLSSVMMNFYDDICGDLSLMAMGRAVGVVPEIHEKMWEAYKKNLFPCGWRGDYPEGKLCIFPSS